MKYAHIREEALKSKVAKDFFSKFDCTDIIRDIDFAVKLDRVDRAASPPAENGYLLWAEAKAAPTDILAMLTQLVLTIGKARTFDKILPPPFLCCFNCEKIAFIPYAAIQDIFYLNDFNWKIAPSNHDTREFKQVYTQVEKIIHNDHPWETYLFDFEKDAKELKRFIRQNFMETDTGANTGTDTGADTNPAQQTVKIRIDKNNFITVYNKWLETVKPTIAVNWDAAKQNNILDGDFYLADLLSRPVTGSGANILVTQQPVPPYCTIKDNLFVVLKHTHYEMNRHIDKIGLFTSSTVFFKDYQKAHTLFWAKYERPPLEEYWDYIVERRDLLVPQDVRERKGSFFTPKIWVELSQKYIADVLGNDWQDDCYVWDCAAGTGNLLAGLTNKYNIWASTLDKADVDVMKDRIHNGANLLESHVFQFDFLNDDFSKLPKGLQDIINDPEKRKKLVVYINPPYKRGLGVANTKWHKENMGKSKDELFAQFIFRVYCEIPDCLIAQFSKLKLLQAPNFSDFRKLFQAKHKRSFLVPANTFDNVTGQFPIGFFIWDTSIHEQFTKIKSDIYDSKGGYAGQKEFHNYDQVKLINDWLITFSKKRNGNKAIGYLNTKCNDFQHNNRIVIGFENVLSKGDVHKIITSENLIQICIYFAVRKVIPADWLNDRDQFLFPNEGWKTDEEFQNDCLAYTLFTNNIQSKYGVNFWIPFTEYQVGARDKFDSNFMTDFLMGKSSKSNKVSEPDLFYSCKSGSGGSGYYQDITAKKRTFSKTAQAVFKAGRELWLYYHTQPDCNVNASLYDIRDFFQGRNEKGKMNTRSTDTTYNELVDNLRETIKTLAQKIKPKVYEYGFL